MGKHVTGIQISSYIFSSIMFENELQIFGLEGEEKRSLCSYPRCKLVSLSSGAPGGKPSIACYINGLFYQRSYSSIKTLNPG